MPRIQKRAGPSQTSRTVWLVHLLCILLLCLGATKGLPASGGSSDSYNTATTSLTSLYWNSLIDERHHHDEEPGETSTSQMRNLPPHAALLTQASTSHYPDLLTYSPNDWNALVHQLRNDQDVHPSSLAQPKDRKDLRKIASERKRYQERLRKHFEEHDTHPSSTAIREPEFKYHITRGTDDKTLSANKINYDNQIIHPHNDSPKQAEEYRESLRHDLAMGRISQDEHDIKRHNSLVREEALKHVALGGLILAPHNRFIHPPGMTRDQIRTLVDEGNYRRFTRGNDPHWRDDFPDQKHELEESPAVADLKIRERHNQINISEFQGRMKNNPNQAVSFLDNRKMIYPDLESIEGPSQRTGFESEIEHSASSLAHDLEHSTAITPDNTKANGKGKRVRSSRSFKF